MPYHSITCLRDCYGWPDCWCHDESDEIGRAYGRMGAQDNSGPLGGAGNTVDPRGPRHDNTLGGVS